MDINSMPSDMTDPSALQTFLHSGSMKRLQMNTILLFHFPVRMGCRLTECHYDNACCSAQKDSQDKSYHSIHLLHSFDPSL